MSATRHEVLAEIPGKLLKIDAAAPAAPELTEELADELTSELAPAPVGPRGAEGTAVRTALPAGGTVLRERYVLESRLGNGGTAMVFRAVDLRRDATAAGGRRVAIKVLRPELLDRPHSIARLQREFRQTQTVAHPNVVRFHDLDCDGGCWFIVMELLTGESLGARLRRASPAGLPMPEALRIASAVGDALAHAHAHGITHGDVKPDNIFLTVSGEVRVLDFGVAQESDAGREPAGALPPPVTQAATRVYASPEILAGRVPEPRDDVFSLACVIYEMLAGAHPYGRSGADAAEQAGVVPQPVASLDAARWPGLAAGLDLHRSARPAMAKFARNLRGEWETVPGSGPVAEATAPTAAGPASPVPRRWKRSRLLWRSAIAAALALTLGILIGRVDYGSDPVSAPTTPALAEPGGQDMAPAPVPAAVMDPPHRAVETAAEAKLAPVETAGEPVAPPGLVAFDSPTMIVSKRAVVAAIPLRHVTRSRRAADVTWRVIEGTARSGRDFGGPETGVEPFIEGNTFRILYVPIIANPGATRDRTFTVELTGASPGTALGGIRRIDVTILGGA